MATVASIQAAIAGKVRESGCDTAPAQPKSATNADAIGCLNTQILLGDRDRRFLGNWIKTMPKRKSNWRAFYNTLTNEQKDMALLAILEYFIDDIGIDGEVQFREADEEREADFYWHNSGDSLIGKD